MPQRMMKMHADVAAEAAKATPPTAVAAVEAIARDGIGPVGWATLAYITLQAAYLLWKWHRDIKREKRGE
jgi:hypothetical protein